MLGYCPLAFAYGVVAVQTGLSPVATVAMSVFVYAGASQFMAVALLAEGAVPGIVILATMATNLRHMLMSASLGAYFRYASPTRLAGLAFHLTDESFALFTTRAMRGHVTASWLTGLQWGAYLSWVGASAVGATLGTAVADPGRWGLDFALIAMFVALLVMQLRNRRVALVAVVAVILQRIAHVWIPGHWAVILAASFAAAVGGFLPCGKDTPSLEEAE